MTQGFQSGAKRYVKILGVLTGLAVVSSILLYSGCGMTSSPKTPVNPVDTTPPTSIITSPTTGGVVSTGATVNINGTASDTGGGTVARVDVSVDGGATYSSATGTTSWSFSWTPTTPGSAAIRSRAVDTSGNVQDPTAQITVTVQDKTPPTSTITFPNAGAIVITGAHVKLDGVANDTGGGREKS